MVFKSAIHSVRQPQKTVWGRETTPSRVLSPPTPTQCSTVDLHHLLYPLLRDRCGFHSTDSQTAQTLKKLMSFER